MTSLPKTAQYTSKFLNSLVTQSSKHNLILNEQVTYSTDFKSNPQILSKSTQLLTHCSSKNRSSVDIYGAKERRNSNEINNAHCNRESLNHLAAPSDKNRRTRNDNDSDSIYSKGNISTLNVNN